MIKFMFERTDYKDDDGLVSKIRKARRISKDVQLSVIASRDSFTTFTLVVDVPYSEQRARLLHVLLKNASLPITNVWRIKNG
nr:MAG TPA: hypothetical protein [Caudoviricetes sp.]